MGNFILVNISTQNFMKNSLHNIDFSAIDDDFAEIAHIKADQFVPCKRDHEMKLLTWKPPCYVFDDFSTCDGCSTQIDFENDALNLGWYHCGVCHYDLCVKCSQSRRQE